MLRKFIILLLCFCFLTSCKSENAQKTYVDTTKTISNILENKDSFDDYSKSIVTRDFLNWLNKNYNAKDLLDLEYELKTNGFQKEDWYDITGNSIYVLNDYYTGVLYKENENYRSDIKVIDANSKNTVFRFVGDVSFADNWHIMPQIERKGKGIESVLSKEVLTLTNNADIFLANNEFAYSNRGTKLPGKRYTFKGKPENVKYMQDMGADIVSIANNHVFDYGADAFYDTLETLKNANINYIGAGENLNEAAKPLYYIINGKKYAFSAATRAEKNIKTPEATDNSPGVMRIYEPTKFIEVIKEAEKECDYNIVYLHWGAEGSHKTEDGLYDLAAKFIDAGADIVIGSHAHVLQGIDYYKDVPIIYNLGNFIFNSKIIDTGIFEISFENNKTPVYKFIPAIQKNCYTSLVEGAEKKRILNFLSSLSPNVNIDDNGIITKK